MSEDWKDKRARRVVTGTDLSGRAVIESDGVTPTQRSSAGFNISDIWTVERLPANVRDGPPTVMVETSPLQGVLIRVVTFQPDSEGNADSGYDSILEPEVGGAPVLAGDGVTAGLHTTDTIDVGTVISGELTLLLPTGETILEPGDTFVLRGTEHAWRNRTTEPVTIVVTMIGAQR
jgi:hypothetical protein